MISRIAPYLIGAASALALTASFTIAQTAPTPAPASPPGIAAPGSGSGTEAAPDRRGGNERREGRAAMGSCRADMQTLCGTVERGKDLLYTVNGGGQLASHSNTVNGDSSGIEGLSVTVLAANSSFTIGVNADTTKVKTAIEEFIADYNKVQSLIDTNTASSTDAKGKVTAGTLATESDASSISSRLRSMLNSQVSGLTTTLKQVENIGIASNGNDNTIAISDSGTLETALANNLGAIQNLFTDSAKGIATQLDAYLEKTIGDDGTLIERQDRLSKQSVEIDTQITDQEKIVQANRQRLISSFLAMESAQQKSTQQLQYLSQRFGSASS